jgi:hypothetical protein
VRTGAGAISTRIALSQPVRRVTLEPRHRTFRNVIRMRKCALASPFKSDLQQHAL